MTTIGLDFVVIKDHRGYEAGFFWNDVQQVISIYHKDDEDVKVKFRNDPEETYTFIFEMPMTEFLEEVKKQLNHPAKLYKDDKEFLSLDI